MCIPIYIDCIYYNLYIILPLDGDEDVLLEALAMLCISPYLNYETVSFHNGALQVN